MGFKQGLGVINCSNRHDEYYTMRGHCDIIAEELRPGIKIWCPFDEEWSNFPKSLREHGFEVVQTSTDFFTTEPPEGVNGIVSKPPFSRKREVIERCDALRIPYCLILPVLFITDGWLLQYDIQVILYRYRMKFLTGEDMLPAQKNPISNCAAVSNGLLKHEFKICREKVTE